MPHSHKITPQEALQRTIEHREIFHDEMLHLMRLIMSGEMSPVMMAALITGLRVKKETIGEITAAAQVMREFSTKVHVADKTHLVDIVGTGGDGSHTFNISTCSMFVAAAAGARVMASAVRERDELVEIERRGKRRTNLEIVVQNHNPSMGSAKPKFVFSTDHTFRGLTVYFALLDFE